MNEIRAQIAKNIKRFRTDCGMNVDEVGAAVGKSGKTVSAWEVGRGQPDADTLIELCKLFRVEITDFYGHDQQVDESEKSLLDLYRSMAPDGRRALVAVPGEVFPVPISLPGGFGLIIPLRRAA